MMFLFYFNEFHIKDECGVGWHVGALLIAIAQIAWHEYAPAVANVHVLHGGGEASAQVVNVECGGHGGGVVENLVHQHRLSAMVKHLAVGVLRGGHEPAAVEDSHLVGAEGASAA